MLRAGVVLEEMHLNDRLWEIKFGHSLPAKGDTLVPQGVNTLPSCSCITQVLTTDRNSDVGVYLGQIVAFYAQQTLDGVSLSCHVFQALTF